MEGFAGLAKENDMTTRTTFHKLALTLALGTLVLGPVALSGCKSERTKAEERNGTYQPDAEQRTKDAGNRAGGTIERDTGKAVEGAGNAVGSEKTQDKGKDLQQSGESQNQKGGGQ
jgi:uncharacterized protein YjbJ (UPF0337 family)